MQTPSPVVFLRGKKTILRPLCKETDMESCVKWLNDPEVRQFLKHFVPINWKEEEEWFDSQKHSKDNIVLAIETIEGRYIGNMGIHRINWKDRRATTGAFIGEKEFWGKGYGTDAKMSLLNYAFNTLGLQKMCSGAMDFNERSIRYSLRCGYKVEGRLRNHIFRNGRFHDEVLLGIFRGEWKHIWNYYQATGEVPKRPTNEKPISRQSENGWSPENIADMASDCEHQIDFPRNKK